jgi:hypothetical protein
LKDTAGYLLKTASPDIMLKVFPNPFHNELTIDYELLRESLVTLTISDATGKTVTKIIEDALVPGNYNLKLDEDDLPESEGLYMVKMIVDGTVFIEKIIKQ